MGEPLENLYFNWLCAKVVDIRETNPRKCYWTLLKTLHTTEFVWLISGDDNRAEDGKDLRREFLLLGEIPDDPDWRTIEGCSVLEMLIGFSRRAQFETEMPSKDWFWEFIDNLGLKGFTDANHPDQNKIAEILDYFIWRMYDINGNGGLFPIRVSREDQRHTEIWYQFCDYLVDQDRLP